MTYFFRQRSKSHRLPCSLILGKGADCFGYKLGSSNVGPLFVPLPDDKKDAVVLSPIDNADIGPCSFVFAANPKRKLDSPACQLSSTEITHNSEKLESKIDHGIFSSHDTLKVI